MSNWPPPLPPPPPPPYPPPFPPAAGWESAVHIPTPERGAVRVGDILSAAWAVFKANYGMLLAAVVTAVAINLAGSVVGSAANFVLPPLGSLISLALGICVSNIVQAGVGLIGITAARGERVDFADLFFGFKRYGDTLLGMLLMGLAIGIPVVLVLAVVFVPTLIIGLQAQRDAQVPIIVGGTVVAMLLVIPLAMLLGARLMFVPMLLLDRRAGRYSGVAALKTSWRLTGPVWGTLFALQFVYVLLGIGGFLLLCVGTILLAAPLIAAANGAAYVMLTPSLAAGTLCPRCGYDLRGSQTGVCPECGTYISQPSPPGFPGPGMA